MSNWNINKIVGLLIMAILLVPQIAHTLYVFEANSRYENPWFSWCYSIGVDLAILVFTANGWIRTAFAYLFATLAHNLAYQYMPEGLWSSLLISVMQSVTLFSLCHLFLKQEKKAKKSVTNSTAKTLTGSRTMQIQKAIDFGIHFEAYPFTCPECKQSFATSKQLNGHVSGHKMSKEWQPESYGDWELNNRKRRDYVLKNIH